MHPDGLYVYNMGLPRSPTHLMSLQSLPQPVRSFYEAFQRGDMDTIQSLYAEDAKLRDPAIGFLLGQDDLTAHGITAILQYFYQSFSNMPAPPVIEVKRWWESGSQIIVEYAEGMMTYLEIFTVRDGKIAGQEVFWGSIPPAPLLTRRQPPRTN